MNVVYIDELFLLNAVLNYILLCLTKRIIRLKSTKPRLLLGSAAGALYAVFMLLPQGGVLGSFFSKFLLSLLLVAIAYKIENMRQYIKAIAVFYITSFALGGAAFALIGFLGEGVKSAPFKILALSTVLSYIAITLLSSGCKRLYFKEAHTCAVTISMGGKALTINCFLDTGNALYEPISDSPVLVAEHKSIAQIVPPDVEEYIKSGMISTATSSFGTKLRFIPFSSVGRQGGVIPGFRADSVQLGDKAFYDIVIGVCEDSLSTDGRFAALANPNALGGAF